MERSQVNNVTREKQIESPVNRDAQFPLKAGQFQQVNGPKEPPGDEAGKLKTENLRHRTAPPQTDENAERLKLKRLRVSAIQDRGNVLSQLLSLPQRVLRGWRTKTARNHIGDRRTVTHRPQSRMTNHGHSGIHFDLAGFGSGQVQPA